MADTSTPNVAAVVEAKHAQATVKTLPTPQPGPGEILVRNKAVAANPVDWKVQVYGIIFEKFPAVLGSDVAGTVVAVGTGVTHFKEGDRVIGFAGSIYNGKAEHGAFQTYTLLNELGATKLPLSVSFERGSVLPMGMATAAMALFVDMGLPRTGGEGAILIWGGASSVGMSAIQIAHGLGYTVFATGSSRHHETLRKLGAAHVFDYREADTPKKIAEAAQAAGLPLFRVFDAVSEADSLDGVIATLAAAGSTKGIKIVTTLPWPKEKALPPGAETNDTAAYHHATSQKDVGRWFFNEWLENALAKGTVVPAPEPRIIEGGLGVTQKLWDTLKAGVSGQKLVLQVD